MNRFLAALLLLTCLAWGAPSAAHTDLVSSDPAPGSTVSTGTASLELGFSETLLPDLGAVSVRGPQGGELVAGSLVSRGGELFVPLEPLRRAGTYSVDFRVVALDGHTVAGRYDFRLTRAGARAGATLSTPAPPAAWGDGSGPGDGPPPATMRALPVPAWLVAGAGLLALCLLLHRAARRRAPAELSA